MRLNPSLKQPTATNFVFFFPHSWSLYTQIVQISSIVHHERTLCNSIKARWDQDHRDWMSQCDDQFKSKEVYVIVGHV